MARHTQLVAGAASHTDPVTHGLPRSLHPVAWWVWALGLAVATSFTTNPLLLALVVAVVVLVVSSRRTDSPWARAFRLYVWLGVSIIAIRVVLHVLVGLKFGQIRLLGLPTVTLPSWAAGIQLGGTLYLEGLLAAVLLGCRLAVMIVCVGAANALANPKRLLRSVPGALQEIGTAVVVSVAVAPQLAQSVQRVLRARRLRGESGRRLRSVRQVALPVLQDTLDRSIALASAMDSRGYGRGIDRDRGTRRSSAVVSLAGLLVTTVGVYGVLDATTPGYLGAPFLIGGIVLCGVGLWLGGRGSRRTAYRPDRWLWPETVTAFAGLAAATGVVLTSRSDPLALAMPLQPLGWPALPLVATVGILLGALPAVLTPPPPHASRRRAADRSATPSRPGSTSRRHPVPDASATVGHPSRLPDPDTPEAAPKAVRR